MPQELKPPPRPRSRAARIFRPAGLLWLKAVRFRVEGELPDLPRMVVVGAPHTTNWDLPNALAAGLYLGERIHWMGKTSIFKWPFGGLMRWLGGVPVDRSKSTNAVAQVTEVMTAAERMVLVIAPEGTRKKATQWKSGFYHIAHSAKVPIVLAFIDYRRRIVGIGEVFHTTGDYEGDLEKIHAYYTRETGKTWVQPSSSPSA